MFLEFGLEVVKSVHNLLFLETFPLDDETVLFGTEVWYSKVIAGVEELIWSEVAFCESLNARFAIEGFESRR